MQREKDTDTDVDVTVSIADAYLPQFDKVVRRCKRAGLTVKQEMKSIGVVSGAIVAEKIPKLEHVEGVAAVERVLGYQLPPPESDVQ